ARPRAHQRIAQRLHKCKTQFSDLALAYSQLEDIDVLGAVVYTGVNPTGRQLSSLWAGSDISKTLLKVHRLSTSLSQASLKTSILQLLDGENRVEALSEILQEKINQPKRCFNWKVFLNTAYKYQIRLVNWPLGVDAPGPDFDFKELQIANFRKIVKAYFVPPSVWVDLK
ncbi:hypothetical protein BV22DRAFT_1052283, partial [Leucogyrophana mollusca]